MTAQKYEIRSEEVEEVMNRSPRAVIRWGNTIILVILFGGALLLDKVRLTQYSEMPVVVKNMALIGQGQYGGGLAMRYSQGVEDLKGRPVVLQYANGPFSASEAISGTITAVEQDGPAQCTLTFLSQKAVPVTGGVALPDSGQVCTAKISTGSRSIFLMIRRQINLLVGRH